DHTIAIGILRCGRWRGRRRWRRRCCSRRRCWARRAERELEADARHVVEEIVVGILVDEVPACLHFGAQLEQERAAGALAQVDEQPCAHVRERAAEIAAGIEVVLDVAHAEADERRYARRAREYTQGIE